MPASNTRTLAESVEWASFYLGRRSFYGLDSSYPYEPALTTANVIIQTMLQPPFKWRWNRNTKVFLVTEAAEGADTVVAIPDFGFIEIATVIPLSGPNEGQSIQIPEIRTNLSLSGDQGRPHTIAPYFDDNEGNISFRFNPGQIDIDSNIELVYQKAPVLMTSTSSVWPIPDSYGHIYDNGLLFYFLLYAGDSRAFAIGQKFASNLIALSEGLDEQDKAIFLGEWETILTQAARGQYKMQLANDGRTR